MKPSNETGRNGQKRQHANGFDVQQLIEMGHRASQLLNSPIYQTAHQLTVNDLINQLVGSEPQEVKKRESLYFQIQAMGMTANQMAMMVARAQELLQRQSDEQRSADDLDRQGFGLDENYDVSQPFMQ